MAEGSSQGDRFGLCGATLGERFYVERQIAEGGFAVVYRAHQLALERPVALKVLKTPADLDDAARAGFRERFAAEAKTVARLKHPYIVAVHDFGVAEMPSGELAPWMALEWLDGETLETDLDRRRGQGGRTPAEAVALLRPVVEAMAYAHRHGVVHRDIKPANMMTVTTEGGPSLRMLDFGIAKIVRTGGSTGTEPGNTSGPQGFSPHYAAPEQVTFSRTGPFTDVHALGLVLTELLTDEAPYTDGLDEHVFEQVMSTARPTLRRKAKSVGRLERIVDKAVSLSPRRRWADAGALLEALDALAVAGELRRNTRTDPVDRSEDAKAAEPAEPPRPLTFTERRNIAIAGAALVLTAFGILLRVLGSGASPVSVASEMAAAPRHPHPARHAAPAEPWIIPLASPPPVAEPPVAEATPPRRAKAASSEEALPAGAPRGACRVTVNSVPWSELWIDGKNTGVHTPVVDQDVACGRHRLEFKRTDLGMDQVEAVLVNPGETFKRRYSLTGVAE